MDCLLKKVTNTQLPIVCAQNRLARCNLGNSRILFYTQVTSIYTGFGAETTNKATIVQGLLIYVSIVQLKPSLAELYTICISSRLDAMLNLWEKFVRKFSALLQCPNKRKKLYLTLIFSTRNKTTFYLVCEFIQDSHILP